MPSLTEHYPWATAPLIANGPMRLLALAPLAVAVSAAGGLGFIGAGEDMSILDRQLAESSERVASHPNLKAYHDKTGILPVGVGVLNWGADLELVTAAIQKWKPAAVWFFGAYDNNDYISWSERIREASAGKTKIWIQIFSVADALEVSKLCKPEVLVVQGTDAGGHGFEAGAGVITLLPEVDDALKAASISGINLVAAGGIVDGRGVAAALVLGAEGVTLGTRFLACEETTIAAGYQQEVIRCSDGGITTARTKVYDQLRGITKWPNRYNGRGILNQSFYDNNSGMSIDENKTLYDDALKKGDNGWGVNGRLTAYAGTGVGLVRNVMKAGDIVREVQAGAKQRLGSMKN